MTVAPERPRDDFDSFYQAHFGQVVAMTYAYTADLHDAQDIAQEAFSRAWQRWHKVLGYDNPAAWVRRVAINLARSRWRRLRLVASYLAGQSAHESVPELNPDHVAIVAALRKLPQRQREVIVWHHIADQPVDAVASQLGIPVGTVKTWLQRGRHSMAADLGMSVRQHITTPPSGQAVERADRRRRKTSLLLAAIVLLVAAAVGAVQLLRPLATTPAQPEPSPSPTPSALSEVDPSDPIHRVDWMHAVVSLLEMPFCPSGRATFTPQKGTRPQDAEPWFESGGRHISLTTDRLALGDVTGDGRAEAVILAQCREGDMSAGRQHLLLRLDPDGTLTQLGWVDPGDRRVWAIWLHAGTLHMDGSSFSSQPIGTAFAWKWTGSAFVEVDTSAEYPPIGEIDLSPLANQLSCQGLPAPDMASLRLVFGPGLVTTAGDRRYDLNASRTHPKFVERGRIGNPYLLLTVKCAPIGGGDWSVQQVLFDRVGGQWQATGLYKD